jgi:hypothetical protein
VDAPASHLFTRRRLIIGGAAGLVLAGYGGSRVIGGGGDGGISGALSLIPLFPSEQPVGTKVRLPLALAADDGSYLDVKNAPSTITYRLLDPGGGRSAPTTVHRRSGGLPRGYYPATVELSAPGTWTFEADVDNQHVTTALSGVEPSALPAVTSIGDPLPDIPTPTTAAGLTVNPICTRQPACPFHSVSLDAALRMGKPIVLIVSTPAHCQFAICGPVLDLLIDRRAKLEKGGAVVIHAEVYADDSANTTSPTVDALGLTYEPALFYAGADGIVKAQLSYVFDSTELDEQLAPVLVS